MHIHTQQNSRLGMGAIHTIDFKEAILMGARAVGRYRVTCRDKDGNFKWEEEIYNLVVNLGLDYLVDIGLDGGTQITTWYAGLTDSTPTVAAADTMASHAGWVDTDVYSNSNRPTVTFADGGTGIVDNSASPAVFNCDSGGTIGGAFLTSNNTVGGTTGTLFGAGAFTGGDRTVANGDTVNVTITVTATAA